MDFRTWKIYFKLYWVRILVISVIAILCLSLIGVIASSVKAWMHMESFYKEQMRAQMGFQLYLYLIGSIVGAAIYVWFWVWMMRGGGYSEFSKLQTKAIKGEDVGILWKDVIGMEDATREAKETVELIRERMRLTHLGAPLVRGLLLIGQPGVGKTYLAKAIATECGMPFLSVVGSELEGIIVGMGARKIKKLFKMARDLSELKGGCIIFVDEVDSVARPRTRGFGLGGGESYNMAVNQLLAEMDGIKQKEENIVIIAATNVPETELDPALMRAGRFDRKIYIGLPNLVDREELFKFYLAKVKNEISPVQCGRLARLSVGNTPADIANIVRESTMIAARKKRQAICMPDLEEAKERLALGIKLNITMSEKDRITTAYHEAGHVIVTYLFVPTKDVFKATIIPRKSYGGATWFINKEENFVTDKNELLSEIQSLLGGYCAEKIKFGITSSGVGKDLEEANRLAEMMVSIWGMGTSGPNAVSEKWNHQASQLAERDKADIINNCFNEVHELLRREMPILERIASELLAKDELDYDAIESIFKEYGKTRLMEKDKKKSEKDIGWNEVIGMDEAKQEAQEIVKLIKDRAQLHQVGGRIIRGLLMFGPPGCGKTYLASAMANEAGLPFLVRTGSEFVEMYVGVGASRVRHLFQEARELALSKGGCIIFIDEMDAIGARRTQDNGGGQREHNQTLNQLLTELDGLKEKDEQYNLVVIGATNVSESYIDPALLRPGRFDRKLYVDLPNLEDREKLFMFYLQSVKYDPNDLEPKRLARITAGWSPADISNLIREAALIAVRNEKELIGIRELEEARERIELGLKRRIKLTDEEKKATAYHEAGHAIATYFFAPTREIFKLSIIPRKETGGVMWGPEKEERLIRDKIQLTARIKVSLGGYVAEKLKCASTSQGVESDFSSALWIAHKMVWSWGMGKSGHIGNFLALVENNHNLISEDMRKSLDADVQDIMQTCLEETEELLRTKNNVFEKLFAALLEKEELNYDEIEAVFKQNT